MPWLAPKIDACEQSTTEYTKAKLKVQIQFWLGFHDSQVVTNQDKQTEALVINPPSPSYFHL